jgi:thiol-disulfide isomerase/thioredoxin
MNTKLSILIVLLSVLVSFPLWAIEHLDDEQIKALPASDSTVLIHFWTTWCQQCRVEIPTLNKLNKKYQSSVQFVAVNMDDVENRGAIGGFLKKYPIEYRMVLRDGKNFTAMAQSLDPGWKEGLPATFLFHDGKRIFSKIGMVNESELDHALQSVGKP